MKFHNYYVLFSVLSVFQTGCTINNSPSDSDIEKALQSLFITSTINSAKENKILNYSNFIDKVIYAKKRECILEPDNITYFCSFDAKILTKIPESNEIIRDHEITGIYKSRFIQINNVWTIIE